MHKLVKFLIPVLCFLALTDCGQKGPLRRPGQVTLATADITRIADPRLP